MQVALFKKNPQTAEEIMALIKKLPDEELDKLGDLLYADDDEDGKPDTMEQIEEAEENIEEKGEDSQSEEDRIDESVGEQEKLDNDEDSQDAKDRVDESEGEEKAIEKEEADKRDDVSALRSRIDSLEETVKSLMARLEADAENADDDKQEFGIEMQAGGSEKEEESDLEKAKRKYWAM